MTPRAAIAGATYRFDPTCTDPDDGRDTIAPVDGVGRWRREKRGERVDGLLARIRPAMEFAAPCEDEQSALDELAEMARESR